MYYKRMDSSEGCSRSVQTQRDLLLLIVADFFKDLSWLERILISFVFMKVPIVACNVGSGLHSLKSERHRTSI